MLSKAAVAFKAHSFPYLLFSTTKKLGWKALLFWIPCHRNLTAILQTELDTKWQKLLVTQSFCSSWKYNTAVSGFFFECRQKTLSVLLYFQKNPASAVLALSHSRQPAQHSPVYAGRLGGAYSENDHKKKKPLPLYSMDFLPKCLWAVTVTCI